MVYGEGVRVHKQTLSMYYEVFTPSDERGRISGWYSLADGEQGFEGLPAPLRGMPVEGANISLATEAPKNFTERRTMRLQGSSSSARETASLGLD